MDTNSQRIAALRALIGDAPLKEFAEAHDLDASYLSQLLNGHRRLGEKAAAKMEAQIGLPAGHLLFPSGTEGEGQSRSEADQPLKTIRAPSPEEAMLQKLREAHQKASPTSQKVLSRLIAAAKNHSVSDDAWKLIGNLLTELEKR
ncbi:hypothetical protein [Ectopseudomonas khazarica]|uniref:hypothetical protein n=1 Tax=Ectopseudomonas khazarica TaxID=2502979 RepID=UPI003A906A72